MVSSVFAQETITITTYYPAPFGIYRQLVTTTLGVGDNNGDGAINGADAPNPGTNPGDVWIAGRTGIGTTDPQARLVVVGENNSNAEPMQIIGGSPNGPAGVGLHSNDYLANHPNSTYSGYLGLANNNGQWSNDSKAGDLVIGQTAKTPPGGNTRFVSDDGNGLNTKVFIKNNGDVGIGEDNPQGRLDINALRDDNTYGGLVPPRVPSTGVAWYPNPPPKGMIVFDTTKQELMVYTNTGWKSVGGGSFGGCYSSYLGWGWWPVNNPFTGHLSCPAGYHGQQILAYPMGYVDPTVCCYK